MSMSVMEAINILRTTVCACGRAKKVRAAFCTRCWRQLSAATRDGLYQRLGRGFEAAYIAALEEIQHGRTVDRHAD
jgi:hypothetical protein